MVMAKGERIAHHYSGAGLVCFVAFVCLLTTFTAADSGAVSVLVNANKVVCFYENITEPGTKIFLHYLVVSGGALNIDCSIHDTQKLLWSGVRSEEERVLLKAREAGVHKICFSNKLTTVTPKVVTFSLLVESDSNSGSENNAHTGESKNDPMLRTAMRVQQGLFEIEEIQDFLRLREREHRATIELANTRVLVWSIIEILVIVAMGVVNVLYLRRMFVTKRVV